MRNTAIALLAGLVTGLWGGPSSAKELAILWAEWDPANFLQELVNEYTAQTGVSVIVETVP